MWLGMEILLSSPRSDSPLLSHQSTRGVALTLVDGVGLGFVLGWLLIGLSPSFAPPNVLFFFLGMALTFPDPPLEKTAPGMELPVPHILTMESTLTALEM